MRVKVARFAAYEAMGERTDAIEKHLKAHPAGDGMVIGDETRLRQIITNLAR
jgi:signal transduction histidine kinase